ncbi:MAG: type II secretion system protein GspG [Candidatus Omnitrophica bacterium]|nr:type II secretion system protein GspG [Candidatus Omnitrophota bacterium]
MKVRGFTIIEIFAVMLVVGILIGITLPKLKSMQSDAKITRAKRELNTLKAALEMYHVYHKTYPPLTDRICAEFFLTESSQMVSDPLYDPFGATSTSEYKYFLSPNGRNYVIFSAGLPGQSAPTGIADAGDITY